MQDTVLNQENATANLSVSAGKMLKQARTDAGLHIAALAVLLRVPVKRIEALENGQMDLLPDTVFVRALTSSICQALKIDASPILEKLPKAAVPRLNRDDVAINTPISSPRVGKEIPVSGILVFPWLLGIVFLCMAIAALYFWPKSSSIATPEAVAITNKLPASTRNQNFLQLLAAAENKSAPGPNLTVANDDVALTTVAATVPPAAIPTAIDTHVTGGAVIASPVVDGENPAKPVNPASLAANNIVLFKASAATWVEVRNASGGTTLKKLLNAGESVGATGVLPLTVIVGRADVTQVEVRGKPFDLAAVAKSNVARFEVK